MRSNKLLFRVVYLLGVALAVALFLVFVPPEARTNVKWMNLVIFLFIYTGVFGRYSLLFTSLGRFSDNVPSLALYWISFWWYAAAALAAMLVMWPLGVGFEKQALIQGLLLFGFIVCVAVGMGASNFMSGETERTKAQVGGVRDMQQKAAQLKILLGGLPGEYSFAKGEFSAVLDEINCVGGCSNPDAREAESGILGLLDKLRSQCAARASADECLATIRDLSAAVALRKTMTNR